MTTLKLCTSSQRKMRAPTSGEDLISWIESHVYLSQCHARCHDRLARFYILNRKKMVAEGLYRQGLDALKGTLRSELVEAELKLGYG